MLSEYISHLRLAQQAEQALFADPFVEFTRPDVSETPTLSFRDSFTCFPYDAVAWDKVAVGQFGVAVLTPMCLRVQYVSLYGAACVLVQAKRMYRELALSQGCLYVKGDALSPRHAVAHCVCAAVQNTRGLP